MGPHFQDTIAFRHLANTRKNCDATLFPYLKQIFVMVPFPLISSMYFLHNPGDSNTMTNNVDEKQIIDVFMRNIFLTKIFHSHNLTWRTRK